MNMAVGGNTSNLNREFATPQKTTNRGVFSELLTQADSETHNCSFHCSMFVFAPVIVQESNYHRLSLKHPVMHSSEPNAMSFTQENAVGLHSAGRASEHLPLVGRKHINRARIMSLYHCMTLLPLVVISYLFRL